MLLLPDIPTYDEWIALLHDHPDQAEALAETLRAKLKDYGISADAALLLSVERYPEARQWVAAASIDESKQAELHKYVQRGRATMAPPPDEQQWRAMLRADPLAAGQLYFAFQLKSAQLGISTPRAITASLAIYQQLAGQED